MQLDDQHLDDERVERLLASELPPDATGAVRSHLVQCAECRGRVGEATHADMRVISLLRSLDHPVPSALSLEATLARARGKAPGRMRWAAGLLLAIGVAGVAYAAPGSPLPRWMAALQTVASPRPSEPALVIPVPEPAEPAMAGIAVNPGRTLTIAFESPWPEGLAVVSLTDGADVVLRAPSGVAAFASAPGRVSVRGRPAPARFDIDVPRSAPRVVILVAGEQVLLVEASQGRGAAGEGPPWSIPLEGRP
jgi:hypothetical protein